MNRPTFDWARELQGADPAQQARVLVMNLCELRSFHECATLSGVAATVDEQRALQTAIDAVTAITGRLVAKIDDEQVREHLAVALRPPPPNAAAAVTEFLLAVRLAEQRGIVQRARERIAELPDNGPANRAREHLRTQTADDNGERERGRDRYGEER